MLWREHIDDAVPLLQQLVLGLDTTRNAIALLVLSEPGTRVGQPPSSIKTFLVNPLRDVVLSNNRQSVRR